MCERRTWTVIWKPQSVAILSLVWAFYPGTPYEYYILLRWVSCGVFAFLAFKALDAKQQGWIWVLGITAAVYNPIIRLHLTKEIWSFVNVVTIGIAVASVFALRIKNGRDSA
ncbi:MAG: DUF6804 family protein [Candidatus Zhuqueibacterota bacterium]